MSNAKDKAKEAEALKYFSGQWADKIKPKAPKWLWWPFIREGVPNDLISNPAEGKSTIIVDIAAALSTGRILPGQKTAREVMRTWIMTAEDEAGNLRGQIDVQKGDPSKILITDVPKKLAQAALNDIKATVKALDIKLLVLDSASSWIASLVDLNSSASSEFMMFLRSLCAETGVTVLVLRHKAKSNANDTSINAGLGAITQSAIYRASSVIVLDDKRGRSYLQSTKVGMGGGTKKGLNVEFNIEQTIPWGTLTWKGDINNEPPHVTDDRDPKAAILECLSEGSLGFRAIQRKAKLSNYSVSKHLADLVLKKVVGKDEAGKYLVLWPDRSALPDKELSEQSTCSPGTARSDRAHQSTIRADQSRALQ